MQIGEFAKVCRTRISVLRHYDKQGLLMPAYTDQFTGYRYYTEEQIHVFVRISALKKAGFSLTEIKAILAQTQSDGEIVALFDRKRTELIETLRHLEEAKHMMKEKRELFPITLEKTPEGLLAKSDPVDGNTFNETCMLMETELAVQEYQRIGTYRAYGEMMSNEVRVVCPVIKLTDIQSSPKDNIAIPFEDDPSVVGKWEIMGTYAVKDDFFARQLCDRRWWGDTIKVLHFLPGGERYWCYSWTCGKVLFSNGDSSSVNPYTVQEYEGERYMFIEWKSYQYRRGGKPIVLVLRQMDNVARTKWEIARRDEVDLSFVPDAHVLGIWYRYGSCRTIESFDPTTAREEEGFFDQLDFDEGGQCTLLFGERKVKQEWTHGLVLNKANHTASAYELRTVDGVEYLLVEWKNGDYIWGGMDPQYVIFTRNA